MDNPRPRVLFVGNFLSATLGRYAVCEALSARLRAEGWTVLTTSTCPGRAARLGDMLHTIVSRRHAYDVAHVDVFSGAAFVWAEAACAALRILRKPFVLSLHGGALPEFARAHPDRVRRLLRGACAVTAPSSYLQERLRPYCEALRLHPNPIDTTHYGFRRRERPLPRLVWVRAFHELYDPSMAIRVVRRLRDRVPGVTLTMAGPDKGDGSFGRARALAAAERLHDAVHFAGGVPPAAVAGLLDAHDVFLNTTTTDNTPVSMLEAMSAGLLTVSTRAGGVPYLVGHEREALLVPVGDDASMAAAVWRVLTDSALAARLSANARAAAARHDWTRVLPLWEDLFRSSCIRTTPAA